MCGIAGILPLRASAPIDPDVVVRMADKLTHRGPDDAGYYRSPKVTFGFRRLSIIDVAGSHQPIENEDGSIVLIGNGEIYNYRELRRQLKGSGHTFRTNGDIETLIHLYEEQGVDLLQQLNGQFAFALWDSKEERLLLARDHVGIAPLFYTIVGDHLIFASEIKALLEFPGVSREVDPVGLDQLLTFPGLVSPRTMFKEIHSLAAGHYLLVQRGKLKSECYWDLDYPLADDANDGAGKEQHYAEGLEEVLKQAVKDRLMSDVPLGYYLSGGLDSSLIAGLIHTLSPNEERHSFSIGFGDNAIDESRYQQIVASKWGSHHHTIPFDESAILSRLRQAISCAETPLKESYNTCSLALSEAVRDAGIKVVLTGEGADELFAGYVGYRFDARGRDSESFFESENLAEREERSRVWGDEEFLYERSFTEFEETKSALYSKELGSRFREFNSLRHPLIDTSKIKGRHPFHKRSYVDFKVRIADHLLADHGDRVALANSVEARYPFLDRNVIEFVKSIPPPLLLKDGIEKFILKKCAAKYVPSEVVNREKFSFVAPGSSFLLRQNAEWIEDLLSYERIKRQGFFNPDTVERLKKMYRDPSFRINQTFDNDLLMIVITFGLFLEVFGAGTASLL